MAPGQRRLDIWDLEKAENSATIDYDVEILGIVFRPDSAELLVLTRTGIELRDPSGEDLIASAPHQLGPIGNRLRFSPDGSYFAMIVDGRVRIWALPEIDPVISIPEVGYVRDASFSPDNRYLAVGTSNAELFIWMWQTEDLIRQVCRRLARDLTPEA